MPQQHTVAARGASRLPLHCGVAEEGEGAGVALEPGEPPGSPSIAAEPPRRAPCRW